MTAKTGLFTVAAAAAIITFAAGWAIPQSKARIAAGQVDTFKMIASGNNCLPSTSQIIPSCSIESLEIKCPPLVSAASYEKVGLAQLGPSPEVVTTPRR